MKIRNGFVSNSSSSSFVVLFPEKPTTEEDVFRMMFGSDKENAEKMIHYYDEKMETSKIAKTVFKDIKKFLSKKPKVMKEEIINNIGQLYQTYNEFSSSYLCEINPRNPMIKIDNYKEKQKIINKLMELKKYKESLRQKQSKIYERIRNKKPEDFEKTLNEDEEYKNYLEEYKSCSNKIYRKEYDLEKELGKLDYKLIKEENPNCLLVFLSYSDNDGSDGVLLEHGNIFSRLKHIKISNH